MPSIAIFTFDPQKLDEVVERRRKEQTSTQGKTKILGEWSDMQRGRVVRLIEEGNHEGVLAVYRIWSDLGKLEVFHVIATNTLINYQMRISKNGRKSLEVDVGGSINAAIGKSITLA